MGTQRAAARLRWLRPAAVPPSRSKSIDGPPPQVFDRMVNVLDSESKLRNLAIVSREGGASYRVRSYLSAQVGARPAPSSPGSGTSTTTTSSGRCGFPARNRPARPDVTPGRRPMTSSCARSRRPASRPHRHGQRSRRTGRPAPTGGGPAVASADGIAPAQDARAVAAHARQRARLQRPISQITGRTAHFWSGKRVNGLPATPPA